MISYNSKYPVLETHFKGREFEFIDTVEESKYNVSSKKYGIDWYYNKNKITYKNNKYGYRCKEFDQLKSGFLLAFGCSNTYGYGLLEKDTWSYKVAKKLNIDLANLGIPSTGPEFIFYNSVLFSRYCKEKNIIPSVICIQWSFDDRSGYWVENDNIPEYRVFNYLQNPKNYDNGNYGEKSELEWFLNSFVEFEIKKINNKIFYPLAVNQIWESFGAKVLNFKINAPGISDSFHGESLPYTLLDIDPGGISRDLARDEGHPGILANNYIEKFLLNKITNG